MKEFIEKLIGRLEECTSIEDYGEIFISLDEIYEIVNQLAEEYADCYKDCGQCEAYDREKHYFPKWCDVIKGTVAEIEENHSNDFCEWTEKSVGGIELVREPHRMKLFHIEEERQFCPYCDHKDEYIEELEAELEECRTAVERMKRKRDLFKFDFGKVVKFDCTCGRRYINTSNCLQVTDSVSPQTNADRIRAMNDEELAEWLAVIDHYWDDGECVVNFGDAHVHDSRDDILEWLQSEVEG